MIKFVLTWIKKLLNQKGKNIWNQKDLIVLVKINTKHLYICAESYNQCPKYLNGEPHHGHVKTCKLCAKLGNSVHYHCYECHSKIPNVSGGICKDVYHQAKLCGEYTHM